MANDILLLLKKSPANSYFISQQNKNKNPDFFIVRWLDVVCLGENRANGQKKLKNS